MYCRYKETISINFIVRKTLRIFVYLCICDIFGPYYCIFIRVKINETHVCLADSDLFIE